MKRIIFILALVAAFAFESKAQKFALIDMEYILKNIPSYEMANEQLKQISQRWEKEITTQAQKVESMYKEYQSNSVFLSDDQKKKKEEEIVDRQGRRRLVKRAEILRRFFLYIIRKTENRFKCRISQVHISSPVKQKHYFRRMFREILPEYMTGQETMLDEGMAVLYNTISNMLEQETLEENEEYEALIIDCGGGTTDFVPFLYSGPQSCLQNLYGNCL